MDRVPIDGDKLRTLREDVHGWSQENLSQRSGVKQPNIARWERGQRLTIDIASARALAAALGVTPAALVKDAFVAIFAVQDGAGAAETEPTLAEPTLAGRVQQIREALRQGLHPAAKPAAFVALPSFDAIVHAGPGSGVPPDGMLMQA